MKTIKMASFRKRAIQLQQEQEEPQDQMRFQNKKISPRFSSFQPILPLVRTMLPDDEEKDKTKCVTFELKVRTGTGATAHNYKRPIRTFEEGTTRMVGCLVRSAQILAP
jgi:hypothetical protein